MDSQGLLQRVEEILTKPRTGLERYPNVMENRDAISDTVISNENSNWNKIKEDGSLVDDKSVKPESNEKECDIIEESDVTLEVEASSPAKETDVDSTKPSEEEPMKTSKRTLTDTESETEPKKIKLVEDSIAEDAEDPSLPLISESNVLYLSSDIMNMEDIKKLSRSDLEEFWLQKMLGAINDKSEIGELRHHLCVYEKMIEELQIEAVQLCKQTCELEAENEKLLDKIRQKNDKPLIPVKTVHSVGLQVCRDSAGVPTFSDHASDTTVENIVLDNIAYESNDVVIVDIEEYTNGVPDESDEENTNNSNAECWLHKTESS